MQLKRLLVDEFSGFSSNVVKRLAPEPILVVDDRNADDYNARNVLSPWFCKVLVEVASNDKIIVKLSAEMPVDAKIKRWGLSHRWFVEEDSGLILEGTLKPGQQEQLIELAKQFENIVFRGRRDPVPNHKHTCARTAATLRRLAQTLAKAWDK